jgi:hypothetical protein
MLKKLRNSVLGLKDVEVTGNLQVGTFKKRFFESFGTQIRVYKTLTTGKGAKPANDKATLASICAPDKKVESMTIKKNQNAGDVELLFKDKMGIGIQIMLPDGTNFAKNDMKLKDVAKAK